MSKNKVISICLILLLFSIAFTGCVSPTEYNQTLEKIKTLEDENKELKEKIAALQASMNENSFSYIKLDKDDKVSGWFNNNGGLSAVLDKPEANAPIIRIGSSKEDVIKALGAPTKIDPNFASTWYYRSVYVKFDQDEKVSEIK